jgi:uncharacterized OB-fold protein
MDLPVPIPCGLDSIFWQAAKEGRLMLQRCGRTGRFQWYPRAHSIHDPGAGVEWVESPGRGSLETFSVVHRSFFPALKVPYVVAVARLEEDVQMTGHLFGVDIAAIAIGMPIQVRFQKINDDIALPCFEAR